MSVIRRLSSSVLLASGRPKLLLASGPESFTNVLTICDENGKRYNISYTCDCKPPLAVEYIITEQIGLTDASTFSELTQYYEIAVVKTLSRRYHTNYNLSLRFVEAIP